MTKQFGILILLLGLLVSSCAPKQTAPEIRPGLVDPALVQGTLDNGFQYLLMKNTTPKDRVSVHLNVFTGSVNETDKEQGLAHFLEHMLFNGSEHFAPGELITYFQSIGMDFGADANARTSFFTTVYDLSLPKGDKKHLEDAFTVIRDYAGGALLLQSEIDRERGVILAEKRERDSVSYRAFKKELVFELPGSLLAQRFPIGREAVINAIDRDMMKGFYDRWYRPDNMALVIVGDMDISQVQTLIEKRFTTLRPRGEKSPGLPDMTWTPHKGIKAFFQKEPEAGLAKVTIERMTYKDFQARTLDDLRQETTQYMGDLIFQNRLSRMVRNQSADFSSASVYSGTYLKNLEIAAVQASCDPQNWESIVKQLDYTLRQALAFGFSVQELERVKAEALSSLNSQAAKASTRKSAAIAQGLLSTLNNRGLFLSPSQEQALLAPHINALTLEEVNAAFRGAWPDDHRLLLVTGNLDPVNEAEKKILSVYKAGQASSPQPYTPAPVKSFPYLKLPGQSAGVVRKFEDANGLGIRQIDFENNIRVNMKPTDFKKGEFSFKAVFGKGRAGMPESIYGFSGLVESAIGKSGFGGMALDELETALAGKDVSFGFTINDTSFSIEGSASPDEAELVFQLLYAYFKDPGFRPKSLDLAKVHYRQEYDALRRTADGVMQIAGNRFLAGGDPRFGIGDPDQGNNLSISEIESWLKPVFESSPLEVSFVGDFDADRIDDLAKIYLGAMEKRQLPDKYAESPDNISFPKGESKRFYLDTRLKDKGVTRIVFLTDDFWDIMQTRQLSLLSRVLSERLRKTIRENLGASYSPYVYNNPSLRFKDYGVMNLVVNLAPDKVDTITRQVIALTRELAEKGVTEAELSLVKGPLLNHLAVLRQSNAYWLNSVMADSFRHPERLDWALNLVEGYKGVRSEDLNRLAKKYLKPGEEAVIKIIPKGGQ